MVIHGWLKKSAFGLLSGALVSAPLLGGATARADEGPRAIVVRVVEEQESEEAEAAPPQVSKYWLGVACLPDDDKPGVILHEVMPDSPAAKAGLQQGDVLLQLGKVKIYDMKDLVRAVADSKGKKSTLRYQRDGEEKKESVQPVDRPEAHFQLPNDLPEAARRQALELVEQFGGQNPRRFLFLQPGMHLPGAAALSHLPEGVSVHIEGQGKKPAKIIITKGDEKWETTAGKLHELPLEVRKLLAPAPMQPMAAPPGVRVRGFTRPIGPDNASAIQELKQQLESLRKAVEELQEK